MKISWHYLIYILFVIAALGRFPEPSYDCDMTLTEILEKMPQRDRKNLEYFFRVCIVWDEFGYVLLGEKPMAFSTVDRFLSPWRSWNDFLYVISPRRIKFQKGFETWRKYEKQLKMKQFVMCYEIDGNELLFTLINKRKFVQTIDQHKKEFKEILPNVEQEDLGQTLLEQAKNGQALLKAALCSHDLLIGILLGYGRNNASLYCQRSQLSDDKIEEFNRQHNLGCLWEEEDEELNLKMSKEINWMSAYITGSHLKNIEIVNYPHFIGVLKSEETKRLKSQYKETRNKIIQYYKGKDFLEATLELLAS